MLKTKNTILDCIAFIRSPFIPTEKKIGIKPFIGLFIVVQLLTLLFAFIDHVPAIKHFFGLKHDYILTEFLNNKAVFFISVVLIAPVVEEFLFRFYLFTEMYIAALLFACIGAIIYFLFPRASTLFCIIYWIAAIAILLVITGNTKIRSILKNIQSTHFKFIFYTSAILFGFVHVSNYQLYGYKAILATVLVLPQIFSGFFLGYLRLRYGFKYAIRAHLFNNLFAYAIFFFCY